MKLQAPCIVIAALLAVACSKKQETQPAALADDKPSEAVAAKPEDPQYWINVRYTIDRAAPGHTSTPHVVQDGTLEIYEDGSGGYKLRTVGAGGQEWRPEYGEVVLKWRQGVRFCSPLDEQRSAAEFMEDTAARRFRAEAAVELHEEIENHELHIIDICPIDPAETAGKREIQIRTDYKGTAHDGVSHGTS